MTWKLDERKDTVTRKRFNQSDYQWTKRQAFPNFISRVEIIYSLDYLWLCDLSFSNKYHCLSVCWSTLWSTCSYVSVSLVLSSFQVIYCVNLVFGISLATITLFSTLSPYIVLKIKQVLDNKQFLSPGKKITQRVPNGIFYSWAIAFMWKDTCLNIYYSTFTWKRQWK